MAKNVGYKLWEIDGNINVNYSDVKCDEYGGSENYWIPDDHEITFELVLRDKIYIEGMYYTVDSTASTVLHILIVKFYGYRC